MVLYLLYQTFADLFVQEFELGLISELSKWYKVKEEREEWRMSRTMSYLKF
jgi:hypothetical protein